MYEDWCRRSVNCTSSFDLNDSSRAYRFGSRLTAPSLLAFSILILLSSSLSRFSCSPTFSNKSSICGTTINFLLVCPRTTSESAGSLGAFDDAGDSSEDEALESDEVDDERRRAFDLAEAPFAEAFLEGWSRTAISCRKDGCAAGRTWGL